MWSTLRVRLTSAVVSAIALVLLAACADAPSPAAAPPETSQGGRYAVGPQYDTTHVYVQPGTTDAFVASWIATFGGNHSNEELVDVTPSPSKTKSVLVFSPVGTLSVFDFQTPVPYPFGDERHGLLVSDFDNAVQAARAAGAQLVVAPFPDPVGRDAIVQFPGGINAQLYWHSSPPAYAPLASVPDNRVYLTADSVEPFLKSHLAFTGGRASADDRDADAAQIGRPGQKFRRISIESPYGNTLAIVTDGNLPYPFGHEQTGYAVSDVSETLTKAQAAGAHVLWGPTTVDGHTSTLVQFPGGYIAEIHDGET
jgi:hypothetical protein